MASFSFRHLSRISIALAALTMAAAWGRSADGSENAPAPVAKLNELEQLWGLSAPERQQTFELHTRAEIAFYDPSWRLLWVRSHHSVTFLKLGPGTFDFKSGQIVQLDGMIRPAEGLSAAQVKSQLVGQAAPVDPVDLDFRTAEKIAGADMRMIQYEGYVARQTEVDVEHELLEILVNGKLVQTRVLMQPKEPVPQVAGQFVRVNGLFVPKKDPTGRITTLDTWVASRGQVAPLRDLNSEPEFSEPRTPAEKWPSLPTTKRVRVVGTVHDRMPGEGLTLRDETGQIVLRTEQPTLVRPGERIEAVGYPEVSGGDWILNEAIFRLVSDEQQRAAYSAPTESLRLAEQVLELGLVEAARSYPVHLGGVVTWSDPRANFFFISDSSGGIRVQRSASEAPTPGVSIDLLGNSAAGPFAPIVAEIGWHSLTKVGFPDARRVTLEQAMTGIEEGQWVELRGYLRDITRDGWWTRLEITSASGEFSAFLPSNKDLSALRGAVISIRGVCSAIPNDRRQLLGVELWVPSEDQIQVEQEPPTDPFSVASQSIASLREYTTLESLNRRVRVSGVVLQHSPGNFLFVQDQEQGLLALSRSTESLQPGDRVDVVGFPGREGSRVVLREAVYRKTGAGAQPVPVPVELGLAMLNEDLDARLVRVTATLLDVVSLPNEFQLTLQAGNTIFQADLDRRAKSLLPFVSGSRLGLTGVYRIEYDDYRKARVFRLQLRGPADIELIKAPSWWTTERAFAVAGLSGVIAFLGFAWVTALRRQVRQKTDLLREQIEKESSLEARYRDIVENASDFIFTADRKGRFTSFNPAGERIFGYTRQEALGLSLKDLLAPEEDPSALPLLNWTSPPGTTITSQTRFRTRDRRVIWVEISARRTSDTQSAFILGVGRDITDRKQIEEELKRARDAAEANTRAKSAFLANMSHEIRTPMNGVIGMSSLLLDTPLNDLQRDFAETIRNSADALLTVLNDILDFSKIEAGKLDFEVADFNLRETVEATIELLAARAASKGLELAALIPSDLPVHLRGDAGRIRQVLLNLIGNAVKFTETGEVVVHVSAEEKTKQDVVLHFEVTDTGIGLSPDAQTRLFAPFSQADSSTTRRFGGTGLGLAICRQIVELMGGSIGVRSTPGQGSTFWFRVKLARQPDRPSRSPIVPSEALRGKRVLIVDDNATNRRVMEHYLTSWGLIAEKAKDGSMAMKTLHDAVAAGQPFHAMVLDYEMPELDGVMLAKRINSDPALHGTRIVLCTSWDNSFNHAELEKNGIVHVMMKPIRQPELLNALLRAIPSEEILDETPAGAPDRHGTRSPVDTVAQRGKLRVLVAEDNVVNQRVTLLQLEKLGYRAELAANGLEVLEALERAQYDVILMDCHMPEMDGYEVTERIRRNPRHGQIKIIAMTANAMQGDRERCLASGMDDYVSKPTRLHDLQDVISRCLGAVK